MFDYGIRKLRGDVTCDYTVLLDGIIDILTWGLGEFKAAGLGASAAGLSEGLSFLYPKESYSDLNDIQKARIDEEIFKKYVEFGGWMDENGALILDQIKDEKSNIKSMAPSERSKLKQISDEVFKEHYKKD